MTPCIILVVDDDRFMRAVLARVLRDHELTVVADARAALALIEEGRRFDLVLCDVILPGMSGIELLEAVLERDADQAERFVFLCGVDPSTIQAPIEVPWLGKPFEIDELRALVARYAGGLRP